MTSLESIWLANTHLTDAGIEHLKGLTNLKWLELHGTEISDVGLERLKELPNLRVLDVYETRATEDGVADLRRCLPSCLIEYRDIRAETERALGRKIPDSSW